jgi:hypothetical protein
VSQGFLIYSIIFILEGCAGTRVLPTQPVVLALPLSVAVIALNYGLLMHRDRWRRYEKAFRDYSTLRNRVLVFLLLAITVGSVALGFMTAAFGTPPGDSCRP